jgi:hypothetical protein
MTEFQASSPSSRVFQAAKGFSAGSVLWVVNHQSCSLSEVLQKNHIWHTAEAEKRYLAISLESMKALHHQKF